MKNILELEVLALTGFAVKTFALRADAERIRL
jgi:hypothetical protein